MTGREDDRFERTQGDWALSSLLLVGSLVLFVVFYPKGGFVIGDKGIIYLNCLFLGLAGYGFYRVFLRPFALRFTPEGTLLIQSVLFPKQVAIAGVESISILENPGTKAPKRIYILQVTGGDPLEVPELGPMEVFVERLVALNPKMKVRTEGPQAKG